MPDFSIEKAISGNICGIDEVGRGPLAGPVVAAAVYIPEDVKKQPFIDQIGDSKTLSKKKREHLSKEIKNSCLYTISTITVEQIDQINILNATMLAMKECYESLSKKINIDHCLIDGNKLPELDCPATAVIKGDNTSISIAAASIIAKVDRDNQMQKLNDEYPGYGWETNSGYGAKKHIEAIHTLGITPHHRKSFEPVKSLLLKRTSH